MEKSQNYWAERSSSSVFLCQPWAFHWSQIVTWQLSYLLYQPHDLHFEIYQNRLNSDSVICAAFSVKYGKMATTNINSTTLNDFSAPWKFSDVVLVVEDQKFHVHRSTLSYWSPVFEKMFTSEFKEKNNEEIPLPGKKASEIEQLLQIMYPSMEEKPVTKSNCYFLFELAHEYQMASISQKCEAFMVSMVNARQEDDVLAMLIYGQKYQLKSLISTCIYEARRLSLQELKRHKRHDEVEPYNYARIAEGIIQRLEATVERHCTVEKQIRAVKQESLKHLEEVSRTLYQHVSNKNYEVFSRLPTPVVTDGWLSNLKMDSYKSKTDCKSLSSTAEELMKLKGAIDTLPYSLPK